MFPQINKIKLVFITGAIRADAIIIMIMTYMIMIKLNMREGACVRDCVMCLMALRAVVPPGTAAPSLCQHQQYVTQISLSVPA